MALIYCKECGKKVSEHAKFCPNCGYPVAGETKEYCNNALEHNAGENSTMQEENTDTEQSFRSKKKDKHKWLTLCMVLTLAGIITVLVTALMYHNIYENTYYDWYSQMLSGEGFEANNADAMEKLIKENPDKTTDEIVNIYTSNINAKIAMKSHLKQLPGFAIGIIFLIGAGLQYNKYRKILLCVEIK